MADLAPFKYLRQGSPIVQRPMDSTVTGRAGGPGTNAGQE